MRKKQANWVQRSKLHAHTQIHEHKARRMCMDQDAIMSTSTKSKCMMSRGKPSFSAGRRPSSWAPSFSAGRRHFLLGTVCLCWAPSVSAGRRHFLLGTVFVCWAPFFSAGRRISLLNTANHAASLKTSVCTLSCRR